MKKSLTKKIISVVLCLCLFLSVTTLSLAAESQKKQIDLVAVIETTGNASGYLPIVKAQLLSEIGKIDTSKVDYRLAIVEYRDFTQYTNVADYAYKASKFMSSTKEIEEYLDEITVSSFSNATACLFNAFDQGVNKLSFRNYCARGILVFGSTKCYNPEPITGNDFATVYAEFGLDSVGDATECQNPMFTFNLGTETETQTVFTNLSQYSGGIYKDISPSSETFAADLGTAIGTAITYVIENVDEVQPGGSETENYAQKLERILNSLPAAIKVIATPIFRLMIVLYNLMH